MLHVKSAHANFGWHWHSQATCMPQAAPGRPQAPNKSNTPEEVSARGTLGRIRMKSRTGTAETRTFVLFVPLLKHKRAAQTTAARQPWADTCMA